MNSFQIKLRTLARKSGLIRVINRIRPVRPYEDRFHQALVTAVRKGDVVWDVGANVGLYTELFCEWTGPGGLVVAFEPGKESAAKIRERIPSCAWLRIENAALSDTDAIGRLVLATDSVSNRLETNVDAGCEGVETDTVAIFRGDTICERMGRAPNVIKIDVESFEEEVLNGLDRTLTLPELRSVLVEVHFAQLERRGKEYAPMRVVELLRGKGFKVAWLDASHLSATR